MKYRIGLVGCGWIAPYQLEGWRLIPNAEIVAVCDLKLERAEALGEQFSVPWIGDDPVRMMEECAPDILDIASTPESHKELTRMAAERGLHVLCQKPAAPEMPDARLMIELAARYGVTLYINEMLRFCPWFRKVHDLLRTGAIGRPVFARLFSRIPGFMPVGPEGRMAYGFREYFKGQKRAIMLEETIHYFDLARYFFGNPSSIYAATGNLSVQMTGEDLATAVLKYPGLTVVIEDSWSAYGPERSGLEIEGSEGAIFLSHDRVLELYSGSTGKVDERWTMSDGGWAEQRPMVFAALFSDFLRTIESDGDRRSQARDNLETLRLTLAAYESAASSKEVLL